MTGSALRQMTIPLKPVSKGVDVPCALPFMKKLVRSPQHSDNF